MHRQIERQRKKCAFKYSAVSNILCDVIADVVDVNVKMRLLASDDRALIHVLQVEKGLGAPLNSPNLNPVDT